MRQRKSDTLRAMIFNHMCRDQYRNVLVYVVGCLDLSYGEKGSMDYDRCVNILLPDMTVTNAWLSELSPVSTNVYRDSVDETAHYRCIAG